MDNIPIGQLGLFSSEAVITALLVLALFRIRSRFGLSPLYVTLGVFQPIQVILASSIYVELFPGIVVSPGSVIMFTASLFAVLLVYIQEDAIETRKAIYGIMLANLTMTLLLSVFGLQLDRPETLNLLKLPREIFNQSARVMLTGTIVLFADVILIIYVYEMISRWIKKNLFLRIYLTIGAILVFDSLSFYTGAFYGQSNYSSILISGIIGKLGMAVFYAAALTVYLRFIEPKEHTSQPFQDFFYALTYRQKYEIEHKRAEASLRKSERQYRRLVEGVPDLIYSFSTTQGIIYWSPHVENVLGFSASDLNDNPLIWHDSIHPVDREKVSAAIKEFEEGKEFEIEYRIKDAHENWHWFLDRSIGRRTEKGEVIIEGIATDITERKQAEEALRESENRFRELAENIQEVFWVFDWREQKVLYVSPAYEKIWGRSARALLKNYEEWTRSTHPDDLEYASESFQRIVEKGGGERREYRIVRPDGTVRWISDRGFVVYDENDVVRRIVGIAKDITEQKQAEKFLQESEEKYRFLADNVSDALWILEIDQLKLIYVSPSIERIQGYTPEELMEIPFNEQLTSQSFELISELISEELAKEETGAADRLRSRTVELEAYCKDGSSKWMEITAGFIRDEKNRVNGIIGVTRDISERRYAEEEKKNLEMRLQQAQKMEAIGTLAGGIAHDFNNILSAVYGYTELAVGDTKKGTMQYENLHEVLKAGNRAKELVQQILTFSRQVDQEKKPIQVKFVIKEALKLLRASIPSTIEIGRNVQSNALVMGDSTQIHQIIINLCTNAAHAMEDKGGILTVSLSDAELDSKFISNHPELKPGPYIRLTVTDTGHGMLPDVLEKIFIPFFTTKEKGAGTGMGLSVVHGIVNSHGGTIYADSEPGKGSSFEVFLPVIERRLKPEGRIEQPMPTGTERILFIDDEPAIVNMCKQILASLGYDVVTRTSSIEALELFMAQTDRFDLVITDMTMPQMTGENLARELFRIRPDIPVILCTGFSARMDENKAMAMGIQAFISKPILKREIAEAIRAVLDDQ